MTCIAMRRAPRLRGAAHGGREQDQVGSSYGARYWYMSSRLASVLFVNLSALASHSRTDLVLWAMLPMRAALVSRWPTSMSQLQVWRLLTQSRKLRACRPVGAAPFWLLGVICGLAPVR